MITSKEEALNKVLHQDNIILVTKKVNTDDDNIVTKDVQTIGLNLFNKLRKSIKAREELRFVFDDDHIPYLCVIYDYRKEDTVDNLPDNIWACQDCHLKGWAQYNLYIR